MNRVSNNFFANTGLPKQNYRTVERCYLLDHLHYLLEAELRANNFVARKAPLQFPVEFPVFGIQYVFELHDFFIAKGIGHCDGERLPQKRYQVDMRLSEPCL